MGGRSDTATATLLFVTALVMAGCGTPTLTSRWRDREVTIDGDPSEWRGALYSLGDGRVIVGCLNDGSNLYLCAGSEDRAVIQQVLRSGLTLWIDPGGGKKKEFGIRFPLGARQTGLPVEAREWELEPDVAGALQDSIQELEILSGERPGTRLSVAEATGIELKARMKDGTLAYELRIPLRRDEAHPYAIGVKPGKAVALGWMTPKIEGGRFGGRRGPGRPGGGDQGPPGGAPPEGGRGRMPGRGGPGGMGGGDRRPEMAGPLDVWVKVRLATEKELAWF